MAFKQGDTFDFAGTAALVVNGKPLIDMTGWTAISQVRTKSDALIADLTVEWLDITKSSIRVFMNGSTQAWPPETLNIDVQFTSPSGGVVSTETSQINVGRDVSRNA